MSKVEEGGRGVKTRGTLTLAEEQKMMQEATARSLAERKQNDERAAEARAPWNK